MHWILINMFEWKACVLLSLQCLTVWRNTLPGLKNPWWAGTSWPRLTWRGSLGSLEGYILYTGDTEPHFECWHTPYLLHTVSWSLDEEVICILFSVQSLTAYFGTELLCKQLMVTGSLTVAWAKIKVHFSCVTLTRWRAFASVSFVLRKQQLNKRQPTFLLMTSSQKTKGAF